MRQKNYGIFSMIHGTWQHFPEYSLVMESCPWLNLLDDKYFMAYRGP